MSSSSASALVVGDHFIPADLFADALAAAAALRDVSLEIRRLQLAYPALDDLPLPESAPAAPFRTLWEDPVVTVERADADLQADPLLREYTGPVDLLLPHLEQVEVLIVHAAPLSQMAVARADRLRVVGCARGGPVNLNLPALNERGIPVFNCPGRNARAVAEFIIGAVLSMSRGITAGARATVDRRWRLDLYKYHMTGHELFGQTCGLVGFGGVGRALAPIAQGFGLRLRVYDPYVSDDLIHAAGAEPAALDTVLAGSSIVVLAARLTDETRNMIGARELALLQPGSIFVNAARAELVDQTALREALADRSFSAVIDVFSPEPPVADDPLLGHEHVLLTPHIAGATREAAHRGAEIVSRNVVAHLVDGSLDGCLNRDAIEPVAKWTAR